MNLQCPSLSPSVFDTCEAKPNHTSNDLLFLADLDMPYSPFQDGWIDDTLKNDLSISPLLPDAIHSTFNNPDLSVEKTSVLVSTGFHPTSHPHLPPSDTLLVSEDMVVFCVHSTVILQASAFAFEQAIGGLLDDPCFRNCMIPVPIVSAELNVILHVLYDLTPASYSLTLENIVNAVNKMPELSLSPRELIPPKSPLHAMLLLKAPLHPMDIYVLAAHHRLHDLAVGTSAHLLSYPMESITDEQAQQMGATYLRKLVCLRLRRFEALKSILLHAHFPHAPSKKCGFAHQSTLARAWAVTISLIVWDPRLDHSTYSLQSMLAPLTKDVECSVCQDLLQARIKGVILQWTAIEHTI